MKAAVLTGPRRFEIRELPDPVAPDDGLVLEVKACGICGSDLRRWNEGPQPGSDGVIPGHEAAGVVSAVGRNVSGYSVGDRLAIAPDIHCDRCYYCRRELFNLCDNLRLIGITPGYPGGFAERMVLTGEILKRGIVHRMPAGMTFAEGALAEPCSSVLAAHAKAQTSPNDTVAILGAGPIGCLHIIVARLHGARAIVSEPDMRRRALAVRFGADAVVDPSGEDAVARVREWTGGVGADIVICANPVAAAQAQAVEMVRKGGRVVLFGGLPKSNPMTTLDANRIHYGEIEVVGAFSYTPKVHHTALELLAIKEIPASLLISDRYPLDRIAEAFETAASGGALKILVMMSSTRNQEHEGCL
ncbi:MAG: alcohol dehydrogenase catalytic domain-containing protein [Candidatus Sumerlaeia bacterium]|nr:alcohol dehydrogenase catalytic domain-containing protein [Candidatus Sumerlaeia bacterium]